MGQEGHDPWRPPSADRYDQNQMGNSSRRNDLETKADTWEKTAMEKIKKR